MVGNFNVEDSKESLSNFLEKHNTANIVKDKTYYKSLNNSSCMGLIFRNRPRCFQNTTVFSRVLSNYHKMTLNVSKRSFSKAPPKEIFYKDYKIFGQDKFKYELKKSMKMNRLDVFADILNVHASFK